VSTAIAPRAPTRGRPSGRPRGDSAPGPARILVTGYPGFLGSALIERLLTRHGPDTRIACLVQPAFVTLATERATALTARLGRAAGRLHLVPGDITREGLGLGAEATRLLAGVRDVFHLAAVYDLGVDREFAHRVNVEGTRHVIEFASALPGLRRLHYVSTCYVSGRLPGLFRERDLERGQDFGNAYEETKYRAEVQVRAAMARGLPGTIYRPAIVVGDSRTGVTQKFDGPYALVRWALRWPVVAPVPVTRGWREAEFNLVPVDFVADAIDHLAALERSAGETYHLANPSPLRVPELLDAVARATGRRIVPVRVPLAPATALLSIPGVGALTGFEPRSLAYTSHPTRYDTRAAERDLASSGVACPPLWSYLDRLTGFVREHPEVTAAAMV
jgi:thioester reductase-like protein